MAILFIPVEMEINAVGYNYISCSVEYISASVGVLSIITKLDKCLEDILISEGVRKFQFLAP